MKKVFFLLSLLLISSVKSSLADVVSINMQRKKNSINHGPSRAPMRDIPEMIASYDDVTSELHFKFSDSNLPFDYNVIIYNGSIVSGTGVLNENGECSVIVEGLNTGRHIINVQIGSLAFEGELVLE